MSGQEQLNLEVRVSKIENELKEMRIVLSRMSVGLTAVINAMKLVSEEAEKNSR